ncbi:cuticle protein 19.8 [Anabrus simplex]|uniref:cuticle protein 19.8 n=1 Tax=Anabrus simplex TaxID=316456 RepID=UPI0035A32A24
MLPCIILAITLSLATAAKEPYDSNPKYNYGYNIDDGVSGDSKSLRETRDGDVVEGSYSLLEPDGTRRVVEYTVDSVKGFNAVVRRYPMKNSIGKEVNKPAPPSVTSSSVPGLEIPPSPTVMQSRIGAPSTVSPDTVRIDFTAAKTSPVTNIPSSTPKLQGLFSNTRSSPKNSRVSTTANMQKSLASNSRSSPKSSQMSSNDSTGSRRESSSRNLYSSRVGKVAYFSAPVISSPYSFIIPPSFLGFRSPSGHLLPGSAIVTAL